MRQPTDEGGPRRLSVRQRHELVLDLLESAGKVSVTDLSRRAHVSDMTVRRDLESLEKRGVLSRVHGGAVAARSRSYEPPFGAREMRNREEKRLIAALAVSLIRDGETVVLDAGTTTLEMARKLVGRRNVRVMALSLRIADVLADDPGVELMVSGGSVRPGERSFIGGLAQNSFSQFSFDTVFLTVGGVDLEAGVTEFNLDDAAVKQAAHDSARRTIAVADSTKLGAIAFARICRVEDLDLLVTDDRASERTIEAIRATGVEVLVASSDTDGGGAMRSDGAPGELK